MEKDAKATSSDISIEKEGLISQSLSKDGIPNQSLSDDLAKPSFSIILRKYQ